MNPVLEKLEEKYPGISYQLESDYPGIQEYLSGFNTEKYSSNFVNYLMKNCDNCRSGNPCDLNEIREYYIKYTGKNPYNPALIRLLRDSGKVWETHRIEIKKYDDSKEIKNIVYFK